MSQPHTPPYTWGQTVTLPARFQDEPGVYATATVRFVDMIDRCVRVIVAGYEQTISFEELDAATEAVTA
jgi:hypothetical protein